METEAEVVNAIYAGNLVNISLNDYKNWGRSAIQDQAGKWIDQGDSIRAQIALQEVARLDKELGFSLFDES